MSLAAHAALFVVFVWWFTTGAIIYLDGLPRRTFPVSMGAATVLLVAALHGLAATSGDTSVTGAYWAFTFALIAWGWNEMGFLMGIVTGPRTTACPDGAKGLTRLGYAIQAVMYHELAIAATGFAIWMATADGANQVGLATFCVLWVMRLSAKINVYLGVPNITEEFLPPHLRYLKTYFRIRPMNAVFPVSITLITLWAAVYVQQGMALGATAFEVTAAALLGTLTVLALVEHWFMVLPIPATALWQWGLVSHVAQDAAAASAGTVDDFKPVPNASSTSVSVLASPPAVSNQSHAPAMLPDTVVPFPTLTPATHRRRS